MNKYNWNARDYEKNSKSQQIWARELIAKLDLTGTESVLDLGCGDGKVTAEIAKMLSSGSVMGIDNSVSMIELATKLYPPSLYKNLLLTVMDACNLAFDERFDVVFSNAALHWIKNHQPVVKGIYKSLRPGGKILLQMGGKGNASKILSILGDIQTNSQWQPYFKNFKFPYCFPDINEYKKLLADAGFKVKRVELIAKDMMHEGKSGLEGWIRTTWLPYTDQIPEQKRDQFIGAISSKYIEKEPVDSNGIVHVSMVRLEVEAVKIT